MPNEKAKRIFLMLKINGIPTEIKVNEIISITQYLNRFYDIFYLVVL